MRKKQNKLDSFIRNIKSNDTGHFDWSWNSFSRRDWDNEPFVIFWMVSSSERTNEQARARHEHSPYPLDTDLHTRIKHLLKLPRTADVVAAAAAASFILLPLDPFLTRKVLIITTTTTTTTAQYWRPLSSSSSSCLLRELFLFYTGGGNLWPTRKDGTPPGASRRPKFSLMQTLPHNPTPLLLLLLLLVVFVRWWR